MFLTRLLTSALLVGVMAGANAAAAAQRSSDCVFAWQERQPGQERETYAEEGSAIGMQVGGAAGAYAGSSGGVSGAAAGSVVGSQIGFVIGRFFGWLFTKPTDYELLLDDCFGRVGSAHFVRTDEFGREHVRVTDLPPERGLSTGSVTFSTLTDGIDEFMLDAERSARKLEEWQPILRRWSDSTAGALADLTGSLRRYDDFRRRLGGYDPAERLRAVTEVARNQHAMVVRHDGLGAVTTEVLDEYFGAWRNLDRAAAPAHARRIQRVVERLDGLEDGFAYADRVRTEAKALELVAGRRLMTQQLMTGPGLLPASVAEASMRVVGRGMQLEKEVRSRLYSTSREELHAVADAGYRRAVERYETAREDAWSGQEDGPEAGEHDYDDFPVVEYGMSRLHYAAWYGLADVAWEILDERWEFEYPATSAIRYAGGDVIVFADGDVGVEFPTVTQAESEAGFALRTRLRQHNGTTLIGAADEAAEAYRDYDGWTAGVDAADAYGRTALHYAARFPDRPEVAGVLLRHGTDLEAADTQRGRTPLHEAAAAGRAATAELLIRYRAVVDAADSMGDTPLHRAARNGRLEVIDLLLRHGADIEARNTAGETPLHHALGRTTAAALLLERGADAEARNRYTRTPLWRLFDRRDWNPAVADLLVRHGAGIETRVRMAGAELSVLHAGVFSEDGERLRWVLDRGADVEAAGADGVTALHRAATQPTAEMTAILLERGAAVGAVTSEGATPLHFAIEAAIGGDAGRFGAPIAALIEHGADMEARDHAGRTPGDYDRRTVGGRGAERANTGR